MRFLREILSLFDSINSFVFLFVLLSHLLSKIPSQDEFNHQSNTPESCWLENLSMSRLVLPEVWCLQLDSQYILALTPCYSQEYATCLQLFETPFKTHKKKCSDFICGFAYFFKFFFSISSSVSVIKVVERSMVNCGWVSNVVGDLWTVTLKV